MLCIPTVPYNLPRLFIATNNSLFTPYRLTTPLSTVEISIRPDRDKEQRNNKHIQSPGMIHCYMVVPVALCSLCIWV